ncbi:MAG: hypothetical protein SXQ77_11255 [Halobacteria archaeon]|nr:hypothetical protein [Halobacteria archaeon]
MSASHTSEGREKLLRFEPRETPGKEKVLPSASLSPPEFLVPEDRPRLPTPNRPPPMESIETEAGFLRRLIIEENLVENGEIEGEGEGDEERDRRRKKPTAPDGNGSPIFVSS